MCINMSASLRRQPAQKRLMVPRVLKELREKVSLGYGRHCFWWLIVQAPNIVRFGLQDMLEMFRERPLTRFDCATPLSRGYFVIQLSELGACGCGDSEGIGNLTVCWRGAFSLKAWSDPAQIGRA